MKPMFVKQIVKTFLTNCADGGLFMYSLKALGGKRLGDVEESGHKVARQPVINSGWMRDVFSH